MWVSEAVGSYRLEVRSPATEAAPGYYSIGLQRSGPATEENKEVILADRLSAEGWRLHEIGTEDALRQAIPKLEEAWSHWCAASQFAHGTSALHFLHEDISRETEVKELVLKHGANALMYLGEVYFGLSDYEKALDAYQQAVQVWQDKPGGSEGWAYNNIGETYNTMGDKQRALDNFAKSLRAYEKRADQNGGTRGRATITRHLPPSSAFAEFGMTQIIYCQRAALPTGSEWRTPH
jgi:tetratricopeptide (TPR) repeat protein